MKFMADGRAEEVHESGSRRKVGREGVQFCIGTHHVDGTVVTISQWPSRYGAGGGLEAHLQFHDRRSGAQGHRRLHRSSPVAEKDGRSIRRRSPVTSKPRARGWGTLPRPTAPDHVYFIGVLPGRRRNRSSAGVPYRIRTGVAAVRGRVDLRVSPLGSVRGTI